MFSTPILGIPKPAYDPPKLRSPLPCGKLVVRGCPFETGRDSCDWRASGTAGEFNPGAQLVRWPRLTEGRDPPSLGDGIAGKRPAGAAAHAGSSALAMSAGLSQPLPMLIGYRLRTSPRRWSAGSCGGSSAWRKSDAQGPWPLSEWHMGAKSLSKAARERRPGWDRASGHRPWRRGNPGIWRWATDTLDDHAASRTSSQSRPSTWASAVRRPGRECRSTLSGRVGGEGAGETWVAQCGRVALGCL